MGKTASTPATPRPVRSLQPPRPPRAAGAAEGRRSARPVDGQGSPLPPSPPKPSAPVKAAADGSDASDAKPRPAKSAKAAASPSGGNDSGAATTSGNGAATLTPIDAQPGQPLYATVKHALIRAIDAGHFPPDQRLPSTKDLSEQMSVSLVTAHRALRELVGEGILDRSRGRGTLVVDRSHRAARHLRVIVMIHRDVSLVDEHHSRLIEGMRQASADRSGTETNLEVELAVGHYGTRVTDHADGLLLLDPPEEDLADCLAALPAAAAKLIVGPAPPDDCFAKSAKAGRPHVGSIAVDNHALAEMVIDHLASMGHQRLAFLGSQRSTAGNRELWEQVRAVADQRGLDLPESHILRVRGWHVDTTEKLRLLQLLDTPDRPTAIVAAGYHFSLDVYEAAATLGRSIPADLSVVGIGNPASAGYLAPPLTCVQSPLVELGHASINTLLQLIQSPPAASADPDTPTPPTSRTLRPELIRRKSVAPA